MSGFNRIKTQVVRVLRENEKARNSDLWLIYLLIRKYYSKIFIPFEDFKKLPSFETITRIRRELQNSNPPIFPPTDPDVVKKRSEAQNQFTKRYRHV